MQDRVRFFSKEDLSLSYYLRMAEGVVDEYNSGRVPLDVNDYLEMYQIILLVKNGIYSDKWDEEKRKQIVGFSSIIATSLNSSAKRFKTSSPSSV